MKTQGTLVLVSGLALALAYLAARLAFPPVENNVPVTLADPIFTELDPWVQRALLDDERPVVGRYHDVFRYLIAGHLAYRHASGSLVHYPGAFSKNGHRVDGLEGFSRMAPLIAAWLHSGRASVISIPKFGEVDLPGLLANALEAGTNPDNEGYWGPIDIGDQRAVESADIALTIWLAREHVWNRLSPLVRQRVVTWLSQVEGKAEGSRMINWRLFPMVVNRVLKSLGYSVSEQAFASNWETVRKSYVGDGWFRDKRRHAFDYYNAWSFQYTLYWLTQIDPDIDTAFISDARRRFVTFYRHFLTPKGLPIFGRSICYRMAAPVPLLIAARMEPDLIPAGEARRALDRIWRYFVNRDGLENGVISQGYCGADMRILDRYSGPASCLWGARSLVIAFLSPPGDSLWTVGERPLAVEMGDFDVTSAASGLRIVGDQKTQAVIVYQRHASGSKPRLQTYSWRHALAEKLMRRPFRPHNSRAKYGAASYRSDIPFCGCIQGID